MQRINGKLGRRIVLGMLVVALTTSGLIAGMSPPRSIHPNAPAIMPADSDGMMTYRAALKAKGTKIMVSTETRWLWLISEGDTRVSAPVAIGMGNTFEYNGKTWKFDTPRGKRIVRGKEANPKWNVPEWHYYEKASKKGLQAVHLKMNEPYVLSDGTWIEVRDKQVGRVNHMGNWHAFTPDFEITLEDKLFIPPVGTAQRQVTEALGPYKLDMGEGYLIHGTHSYTQNTIGQAASHGCVRMRNTDLSILYQLVDPGTPVFIY